MQKIVLGLLAVTILSSCGGNSDSGKTEDLTKKVEALKKIKANPETAEGMIMIQHMVNSFNEMQEENKNYAYLLGELSFQCDYIFMNCSMKGANHDSLHTVLEPILASIQSAKNDTSVAEINQELQKILNQTERFFNRFETQQDPA